MIESVEHGEKAEAFTLHFLEGDIEQFEGIFIFGIQVLREVGTHRFQRNSDSLCKTLPELGVRSGRSVSEIPVYRGEVMIVFALQVRTEVMQKNRFTE